MSNECNFFFISSYCHLDIVFYPCAAQVNYEDDILHLKLENVTNILLWLSMFWTVLFVISEVQISHQCYISLDAVISSWDYYDCFANGVIIYFWSSIREWPDKLNLSKRYFIPLHIWKLFPTSNSWFHDHTVAFCLSCIFYFQVDKWVYMALYLKNCIWSRHCIKWAYMTVFIWKLYFIFVYFIPLNIWKLFSTR